MMHKYENIYSGVSRANFVASYNHTYNIIVPILLRREFRICKPVECFCARFTSAVNLPVDL